MKKICIHFDLAFLSTVTVFYGLLQLNTRVLLDIQSLLQDTETPLVILFFGSGVF